MSETLNRRKTLHAEGRDVSAQPADLRGYCQEAMEFFGIASVWVIDVEVSKKPVLQPL